MDETVNTYRFLLPFSVVKGMWQISKINGYEVSRFKGVTGSKSINYWVEIISLNYAGTDAVI